MADDDGDTDAPYLGKPCDLCGESCEANEELNQLSCSFPACDSYGLVYHQDCIERYLKSIRLERNRKTGFKCPRGCGKKTSFEAACPGKVDKSHPILPRSEVAKRRKKAPPPPPPAPPVAKAKPVAKPAEAKPADGAAKPTAHAVAAKPAQPAGAKPSATSPPVKATATAVPPVKAPAKAVMSREALAAAAATARRELGLGGLSSAGFTPAAHGGGTGSRASQEEPSLGGGALSASSAGPSTAAGGGLAREPSLGLSMRDFFPQLAPALGSGPAEAPPPPVAAASSSAWGASRPAPAQGLPQTQPAGPATGAEPQPLRQVAPGVGNGAVGGAEGLDEDGQPRVSKREKKRQAAAAAAAASAAAAAAAAAAAPAAPSMPAPVASSVLPPPVAVAAPAAPPAGWLPSHQAVSGSLEQRLAEVFRRRQSSQLAQQLSSLGFPPHLCVSAVRRFGDNVDAAASWLMDGAPGPEEGPHAELSLADQLAALDDLAALGFPVSRVKQAVVDADGDFDVAVVLLLEGDSVAGQPGAPPPTPAPTKLPAQLQGADTARWSLLHPEQPRTPVPPSEPVLVPPPRGPLPVSPMSPTPLFSRAATPGAAAAGGGQASSAFSSAATHAASAAPGPPEMNGGSGSGLQSRGAPPPLWSTSAFSQRPGEESQTAAAASASMLGLGGFTSGLFARPASQSPTGSLFNLPSGAKPQTGGLGGFGGLFGGGGASGGSTGAGGREAASSLFGGGAAAFAPSNGGPASAFGATSFRAFAGDGAAPQGRAPGGGVTSSLWGAQPQPQQGLFQNASRLTGYGLGHPGDGGGDSHLEEAVVSRFAGLGLLQ